MGEFRLVKQLLEDFTSFNRTVFIGVYRTT
jgi:hypothetical protein